MYVWGDNPSSNERLLTKLELIVNYLELQSEVDKLNKVFRETQRLNDFKTMRDYYKTIKVRFPTLKFHWFHNLTFKGRLQEGKLRK